jgi:hypothetical protein
VGRTSIRAVSLLVLLAAAHRQALAQGVDPDRAFRTTAQGISAGKFLLFPSITVETGYDDNVFYQSDSIPGTELVSSGRLVLAPKIMFDLPLSRSRTRLAYTLQYRDYSSEEFVQANHLSHFFDFDAWVRVGDNLTLALREHYVEGTQEVQQFDPGGEVRFGLVPFTLSEPTVEVNLAFGGRHQVALLPRLSTLNFDDKAAAGFYDYERRGLTGRYQYQVDPATAAFASYFREKTDQDRATSYFGDIDVETRYIGAGLQRSFGGSIASSVSAGYETQDYEGGFGENFSGLVCDINLAWSAADVYRFELLASRQPYQSFFVNSNYYLSNMIRVRVAQQLGRSAYWVAGLALQRNPYADPVDIRVTPDSPPDSDLDGDGFIDVYETLLPSQGKLRRDGAFIVELAAGMRLSPSLRLTLGYNHEARDSNIEQSFDATSVFEPFDYTVDRVFLRIEAGIL